MTQEDLATPYSTELYASITENLIGHDFSKDTRSININPSFKYIKAIDNIGFFEELGLQLFAVKHTSERDARIGLSKELFSIMKEYSFSNALVATHSGQGNWRYSLLTSSLKISTDGKVIRHFSNPKRYSYMLGPHAKTATPYKYLIKNGKVSDFNDLQKRFSVEVVNNEFYGEIARLYDELVGTEKIASRMKYPSSGDESHEFAVRLIGRIIFCWFLREKKSKAGIALIPSDVLSRDASNQSNYYHTVLAPLFFEVLNKPASKRTDKFKTGVYADVPYLNGGLFNDDNIDHYIFDKGLEVSVPGLIDIPNSWVHQFFDLLERFNFTVDENTSYDTDLSIDPEMLGRVFENLLARINPETGETVRKSTGSFYTPREIVEYMVDASLSEYLVSKASVSREKIDALISYDLFDDLGYELNKEEGTSVLEALSTLTVLDPACGSGAFPIGMLQKIVFIITKLDPNAEWWLAKQLEGASLELKREFTNRSVDYVRKLGIIRQTIFGVDIQSIATEISRLRCFLTLIVDEAVDDAQENRGIRPLPNLDFKFVTANSLITLPKPEDKRGDISDTQAAMFEETSHIDELKQIRNEYFSSTSHERSELQTQFMKLQKKMVLTNVDVFRGSASKLYDTLSRWDPFEHTQSPWFDPGWMFGISDGFDIIIANPPYVRQENYKEYKERLKAEYPSIFDGRADLYTYFIKLGFDLLHDKGTLTFITSNKYLVRGYGRKIRKFLSEDVMMQQLINFGELPVFKASVDSAIIVAKRRTASVRDDDVLRFVQAKTVQDISNVGELFASQHSSLNLAQLNEEVWVLEEPVKLRVLEKIKQHESTLGSTFEIFGGIKTGFDEAFVISAQTRKNLIKADPKSEELIKPWFKGREVKKWFAQCEQYIIYIPQRKININDYPAVKAHLLPYRDKLSKRATSQEWFELQQPQERFTRLFEEEKIIYCEIAKQMRAFKDNSKAYGTMKMFFIPFHPVVLAILNSSLFDWYARMTFSSLGDPWSGGRLEFKSMYMSNLPLPLLTGPIQQKVTELVNEIDQGRINENLENNINELVYKLYNLTPEEITIIEGRIE